MTGEEFLTSSSSNRFFIGLKIPPTGDRKRTKEPNILLNVVVFLSQIRESVINRFVLAKHHYLLSDLVIEEEIPSIG